MMDLTTIPTPAVVLSDHLKSFWSRQIKLHTHGQYSHAMWLRKNGKFLSQNGILREVDPVLYLNGDYRLKFFANPALGLEWQDKAIETWLEEKLKNPTRYDWLGIIGHLLHRRRLQSPGKYYCSELVWEPFVKILGYKPIYPSPAELDYLLPKIGWEVQAIYDPTIQKEMHHALRRNL